MATNKWRRAVPASLSAKPSLPCSGWGSGASLVCQGLGTHVLLIQHWKRQTRRPPWLPCSIPNRAYLRCCLIKSEGRVNSVGRLDSFLLSAARSPRRIYDVASSITCQAVAVRNHFRRLSVCFKQVVSPNRDCSEQHTISQPSSPVARRMERVPAMMPCGNGRRLFS